MGMGSLFVSLNWKEKGKFFELLGGVAPADIPHLSMSSARWWRSRKGFRFSAGARYFGVVRPLPKAVHSGA